MSPGGDFVHQVALFFNLLAVVSETIVLFQTLHYFALSHGFFQVAAFFFKLGLNFQYTLLLPFDVLIESLEVILIELNFGRSMPAILFMLHLLLLFCSLGKKPLDFLLFDLQRRADCGKFSLAISFQVFAVPQQ